MHDRVQTADFSRVTAATTDTSLLTASGGRKGFTLWNNSTASLYLVLGTRAASTTTATFKVDPNGYYESPFGYGGAVRGIWDAANGFAHITLVSR
jgi:hypothetical protein